MDTTATEVLREAVGRGDLGELAVLRFTRSCPHPTDAAWSGNEEPRDAVVRHLLLDDVDVAVRLAGPVTRVSAVSTQSGSGAGADDDGPAAAAHVLLAHAGGAVSQVSGFWGPAHLQPATSFSVTGTEGSLEHSSVHERAVVTDLGAPPVAGALRPEARPGAAGQHAAQCADQCAGDEAVRVVDAAIEAARTATTVHLPTTEEARA